MDLAEAPWSWTLMTGHTFEYNGAIRALRNIVNDAASKSGGVYYVDAARLNLGLFQADINVLWDLAPHDLSILLYVLDQPVVAGQPHRRAACSRTASPRWRSSR